DFSSTLQDLATEGIGNVVEIQKLELLAGNLVRDYYETAKQKKKVRIKKYAAAEREEFDEYLPNYLATREEIELTKFHEERENWEEIEESDEMIVDCLHEQGFTNTVKQDKLKAILGELLQIVQFFSDKDFEQAVEQLDNCHEVKSEYMKER
ncbi:27447_t:CDS:2, partial [Racocetra persica]